jgi:hypothetical protein
MRRPSDLPRLRHVGRSWVPAKKLRHARSRSLSACCWTVCDRRQPRRRGPGLRQLPGLLHIARRRALPARPHQALLVAKVPHVPGVRALLAEEYLLRGCGVEPEPHTVNVVLASDTQVEASVSTCATQTERKTMSICSSTTRPRWRSPAWSTPSRKSRPACSTRKARRASTGRGPEGAVGHRPTTPTQSVAGYSRSSRPTRSAPLRKGFLPALKDRVSARDHR